jgi:hypothetical protein
MADFLINWLFNDIDYRQIWLLGGIGAIVEKVVVVSS